MPCVKYIIECFFELAGKKEFMGNMAKLGFSEAFTRTRCIPAEVLAK